MVRYLFAALLVLSVSACGGATTATPSTTIAPTAASTPDVTATPKPTPEPTPEPTPTPTPMVSVDDAGASYAQIVMRYDVAMLGSTLPDPKPKSAVDYTCDEIEQASLALLDAAQAIDDASWPQAAASEASLLSRALLEQANSFSQGVVEGASDPAVCGFFGWGVKKDWPDTVLVHADAVRAALNLDPATGGERLLSF